MDPFEVRQQFISLLSRLSSSLASIQKLSSFALKYGPKCGEDLWDCLIDECGQVNLNARINLLYFLDTLLDKHTMGQPYKALVKRDLARLVDLVVPITREGVLNLMSTNQVLRSWRTRRLLDADILDPILLDLEGRKASVHSAESDTSSFSTFSRNDILRRIEDDRERHKRLRERIWVLPISTSLQSQPPSSSFSYPNNSNLNLPSTLPSPTSPASPSEVASYLLTRSSSKSIKSSQPLGINGGSNAGLGTASGAGGIGGTGGSLPGLGPELAIEIEFDQLWDSSLEEMILAIGELREKEQGEKMQVDGDEVEEFGRSSKERKEWPLSEEDLLAMRRERERCFAFLGN